VSRISRSFVVVEWADGSQITTADLNGHEDDHGDESPFADDGSQLAKLFLGRGDVKYVVLCTLQRDSLVEHYGSLQCSHLVETHRDFKVTVLTPKMTPGALMKAAAAMLPPEVVERHEEQNHKPTLGDCINPALAAALYANVNARHSG
jgi:hypothetical protein